MTGKLVLTYFVAFFGFIAAVNAVMVTLAIRTHSGTVTEHPYEMGIAYNAVVDAEAAQKELGWKGSIGFSNGVLHFSLHDKNNQLILPHKATATITRPTQAGFDFTVELEGMETSVKFPMKGVWEVRVDASHEGIHYQQSKRIVVE